MPQTGTATLRTDDPTFYRLREHEEDDSEQFGSNAVRYPLNRRIRPRGHAQGLRQVISHSQQSGYGNAQQRPERPGYFRGYGSHEPGHVNQPYHSQLANVSSYNIRDSRYAADSYQPTPLLNTYSNLHPAFTTSQISTNDHELTTSQQAAAVRECPKLHNDQQPAICLPADPKTDSAASSAAQNPFTAKQLPDDYRSSTSRSSSWHDSFNNDRTQENGDECFAYLI